MHRALALKVATLAIVAFACAQGCSSGPSCGNPEQLRGCACDADPAFVARCLFEAGLVDAAGPDGGMDGSHP